MHELMLIRKDCIFSVGECVDKSGGCFFCEAACLCESWLVLDREMFQ